MHAALIFAFWTVTVIVAYSTVMENILNVFVFITNYLDLFKCCAWKYETTQTYTENINLSMKNNTN